jgi:hypothetical protein
VLSFTLRDARRRFVSFRWWLRWRQHNHIKILESQFTVTDSRYLADGTPPLFNWYTNKTSWNRDRLVRQDLPIVF